MSLPTTLRKALPGSPLLSDALAGLARTRKTLPSKYFYDAEGSALFVQITELPEYYPTRTELAILTAAAPRLAALTQGVGTVVEYGSGDGRKSLALLQALPHCKAYVPVEISGDALLGQVARLATAMPELSIIPQEADFTHPFSLPAGLPSGSRLGFFPGSTIGNLVPSDAVDLLRAARETLGVGSLFVLGVDLKKPLSVLIPAYDDASGVTAAFNLNLLGRLNRELGADFRLDQFAHCIRYDAARGRIEMHLESLCDQEVQIDGHRFAFHRGETIHTENSHKFTVEEASLLARAGGWEPVETFVDPENLFAVILLASARNDQP